MVKKSVESTHKTKMASSKKAGSKISIDPSLGASSSRITAQSRMPKIPALLNILKQRALALSSCSVDNKEVTQESFVRVRLGPLEHYGIPYSYLEHITQLIDFSRIPCTPPVISGVANYRGELLTLLDLKQLFHIKVDDNKSQTLVVVVRVDAMRVGLMVDEIFGNDTLVAAHLDAPMHTGGVSNLDYVQGIYQGKVTILNIRAILADPSLQVNEHVK